MLNESYLLPSALSIVVSFFLLLHIFSLKKKTSKAYIALIISIMVMNGIELIGYFEIYNSLYLFKIYYVFSLISLMLVMTFIFELAQINYLIIKIINPLGIIIISLILTGDLIILDYEPMGYSYQRVPGKFYAAFDIYVITFLTIALVMIFRNIFSHNTTSVIRARSGIILVSLLPMLILALLIVYLMAAGFNVNLAFYFPLTTIFFILGSLYAFKSNPYDLTRFLPLTKSSKKYKFLKSFYRANVNKSNFFELIELIEKEALIEELQRNDKKVSLSSLAKIFNSSVGKIDYKLKKYGLKKYLK